jgi:hypothetical protein
LGSGPDEKRTAGAKASGLAVAPAAEGELNAAAVDAVFADLSPWDAEASGTACRLNATRRRPDANDGTDAEEVIGPTTGLPLAALLAAIGVGVSHCDEATPGGTDDERKPFSRRGYPRPKGKPY